MAAGINQCAHPQARFFTRRLFLKKHTAEQIERLLTVYQNARMRLVDRRLLQCDGVNLRFAFGWLVPPSDDEAMSLLKDPSFVLAYLGALKDLKVKNILEVGIFDGGSSVFFWSLFRVKKMCCIDLKDSVPHLEKYISEQALDRSLSLWLGVDQGDQEKIRSVIKKDFCGDPIDLIIDDACHLYHPSKKLFETTFPSLRCGGFYVLEDWKANLAFPNLGGGNPDRPTLHQLAYEITVFSMYNPDVIASVRYLHNFVIFERGSAPIDPYQFSIDELAAQIE